MSDAGHRLESDSMGTIAVPAHHYWGAQTQRSIQYFSYGQLMPLPLIHALGVLKASCAEINHRLGRLDALRCDAIVNAAERVAAGEFDSEFPLRIWQTGSGTQTNMNANEVIANLAIQSLGGQLGSKRPIHPNDHVNLSQSSNDVFPTALHMAAALALRQSMVPAVEALINSLGSQSERFATIVKVGRTHLQDAVPLSLGQEFSGYAAQLKLALEAVRSCMPQLLQLAIGGTAVGTGLNAPPGFGAAVAARLAERLGMPFCCAANRFAALAGHEALAAVHGALTVLAGALFKIANDIRWLGSGPRCGLGELVLPQNEPGSSIMPGKVNPTQAESVTMVALQVMGNNTTVQMAASQGNFELNVFKPLLAANVLQSIELLTGACNGFNQHCIVGLRADERRIGQLLDESLMLVTALTPAIGYDRACQIANHAHKEGISLRAAGLALGAISASDFDRLTRPEAMIQQELRPQSLINKRPD